MCTNLVFADITDPTDFVYPSIPNIILQRGDRHVISVSALTFTKPPMNISFTSDLPDTKFTNTTEWIDDSKQIFGKKSATFEINNASQSGSVLLTYYHISFENPVYVSYQVTINGKHKNKCNKYFILLS